MVERIGGLRQPLGKFRRPAQPAAARGLGGGSKRFPVESGPARRRHAPPRAHLVPSLELGGPQWNSPARSASAMGTCFGHSWLQPASRRQCPSPVQPRHRRAGIHCAARPGRGGRGGVARNGCASGVPPALQPGALPGQGRGPAIHCTKNVVSPYGASLVAFKRQTF